jgi:hypothetical protein
MDLTAYRISHRLIDVVILRRIFGGKALNAVSGSGAAVHEKRHAILNKWLFAKAINYGCLRNV